MKVQIEMTFKKETKGTYVYENSEEDAPITVLYVKKAPFKGKPPETISVTIQG